MSNAKITYFGPLYFNRVWSLDFWKNFIIHPQPKLRAPVYLFLDKQPFLDVSPLVKPFDDLASLELYLAGFTPILRTMRTKAFQVLSSISRDKIEL